MKSICLSELAAKVNASLEGDAEHFVDSVASIDDATFTQVTFLTDKKYLPALADTNAGVVVLHPKMADAFSGNKLISENPYYTYALIAQYLDTTPDVASHQSSHAFISPLAEVAQSAKVAPFAVIEDYAVIGENVQIGSNTVIGANAVIGANSKLYPNTTIYHHVVMGENCIVHSGAVLGSDGFGFANDNGRWVKIPQIGRVVLGDNVEIGSNVSIDRGAIKDTILSNGVKIDNQVHLAHNVEIDENSAVAANTAIAGSTQIGKRCTFAGIVGVNGHIKIGDDCHFTGMSMVTKNFSEPGVYSSGIPATNNKDWRKNTVKLRQVDTLFDRVKELEKQLAELTKKR